MAVPWSRRPRLQWNHPSPVRVLPCNRAARWNVPTLRASHPGSLRKRQGTTCRYIYLSPISSDGVLLICAASPHVSIPLQMWRRPCGHRDPRERLSPGSVSGLIDFITVSRPYPAAATILATSINSFRLSAGASRALVSSWVRSCQTCRGTNGVGLLMMLLHR